MLHVIVKQLLFCPGTMFDQPEQNLKLVRQDSQCPWWKLHVVEPTGNQAVPILSPEWRLKKMPTWQEAIHRPFHEAREAREREARELHKWEQEGHQVVNLI